MTHQPPREDDEIAAILARLREEVYGRPPSAGGSEPSVAREEAERMWPVSADRPFLEGTGSRGRARGLGLRLPKSLLRKLMRWYVEPPFADQRRFNAAVLRLLDELWARNQAKDGTGRGVEADRDT